MKVMCLTLVFFVVQIVSQYRIAAADNCGSVPIEVWGGKPLNRATELRKPVNLVVIQHTVTKECLTDAECESIVKSIREYQIKIGFDDIGASFLVGGNGKVYEGAGWKVGAHTLGYNDRSIGVTFIGDFREKLPTLGALQSAQSFLSCSINNNNLGRDYFLVGHKQLSNTLSPGEMLQHYIETWLHWLGDIKRIPNN